MRSKKIKYALLGIFLIILGVALYAYKEYNRGVAKLDTQAAAYQLQADSLIGAYTLQEDSANAKYLGKILQVKGIVAEVLHPTDAPITLSLGDSNSTSKVSCSLDSSLNNANIYPNIGDSITIKGVCTGYLIDVELNRCVIVKR